MGVETAAAQASQLKIGAGLRTLLLALLLVGLAAWPRLAFLGQFSTVDEVNFWYRRTNAYDQALRLGDYAATLQSGHPGATTMALGTLGLRLPLEADRQAASDYLARLARARLPLALANALAVGLGYLVLLRLYAPATALLGAALWGADLLLIGHSRLLHLDALLASCMTLSLLLLCAAIVPRRCFGDGALASQPQPALAAISAGAVAGNWLLVVLAGVCAGLALATKAPAILLMPLSGLVLLLGTTWPQQTPWREGLRARLGYALPRWLLFVALMLATLFICWPAMWVTPRSALKAMIDVVAVEGTEPHATGNYFLGRYVDDPGAAFYPLVLLFRLSPLTWLGLVVLPLALFRERALRRSVLLLALFVLAFLLMIALSAKKFDRYLLPVFPTLNILAAVGLVGLGNWLAGRLGRRLGLRWLGSAAALALCLPVALGLVCYYQPYQLAYFNPLLGGGPVAQRIFLIGWGEGLEQAAAFINQEPASAQQTVASTTVAVLRTSANFDVIGLGRVLDPIPQEFPNYLVLYANTIQRGIPSIGAQWMYDNATPLYIVRIHGLEYARVYQIPPAVPQPLAADFGSAVHLRGYDIKLLEDEQGLQVRLFWEARGATAGDALLFLHLIGPDGKRYAQIDLPPGGNLPTSAWSAGRFLVSDASLSLPNDAPAGQYSLTLGVYDLASGTRLPLVSGSPADEAIAGPNALLLTSPRLR